LRHAPWYTLTIIGVLAVGSGLTTVAFAIVDGVLFKPLPFDRAGELYLVRADASTAPQAQPPAVSWRDIRAWQGGAPGLAMSVVSHGTPGASGSIDERFFEITGTSPLLGGFSAADFDWLESAERVESRLTVHARTSTPHPSEERHILKP
jgi:hypothetical protein